MSSPSLILFHDARAAAWAPFADTRPVGELVLGTRTLRARAEAVTGLACAGHLAGPALAGFDEEGAAPGIRLDDLTTEPPRVFLSARVALADGTDLEVDEPTRLTVGGVCVGWAVPAGAPHPDAGSLAVPDGATDGLERSLGGEVLDGPWDLVARTAAWLSVDLAAGVDAGAVDGVVRVGSGTLTLAAGAAVEPGVVVDTRGGPVHVAEGARVEGPARLVGPLYVGPGSTILGGVVAGSSIGPVCKIRGEVADSVFLGFANKAHDGHLGHAVVGRWANLGAGTTNSDLKNTYGSVRVWTPDGDEDTGLMKVGCFLGDHAKTAIGTRINTGTVVGAGANLFGDAMPPKRVPPFAWGSDAAGASFRLEAFFEVAERAMARRNRTLTPGVRAVLTRAWHAAGGR